MHDSFAHLSSNWPLVVSWKLDTSLVSTFELANSRGASVGFGAAALGGEPPAAKKGGRG